MGERVAVRTKRLGHRLDILAIVVVLVFVSLISRLGYLQVVQGKYYGRMADGNRIKLIPIMAPRGSFLDRNGVPLVSNRPSSTVSLIPISGPIPDEVIERLAAIIGMNAAEIKAKVDQQKGSFEPVRVKSDIGPDIVTIIQEHRGELPGVVIEIQPIRSYVYNELGAHIFGYVSEISEDELEKKKTEGYKTGDIVGKFGLEKFYDKYIRGVDGGRQVEVDVTGQPIQVLGRKEPLPGNNLQLTIDFRVQKAAEEAIDEQLI